MSPEAQPNVTPAAAAQVRPVPAPVFEAPPDRERRNPFYRWLMHLGLPLALSLTAHVLLFSAMALKTWPVLAQREIQVGDYEAGLVQDPNDRPENAFQWSEQPKLDTPEDQAVENLSLTDFSRVDTVDDAALKESPAADAGAGDNLGFGEGRFSLLGTGEGAGEAGSGGFGAGVGGRGGRLGQAGVWNVRVQANKIAYVVDFSGSILVAVDDLKRELKRSISQLRPSQSFDVMLFYGEDEKSKTDVFAATLQPANDQTRKSLFDWLDRRAPKGDTDPLPAMKRALALRPEAVFFFSDGLFDDAVITEITNANRTAGARILCFVFDEILLGDTSRLPKETDGARRLRKIAERNRGQVKIVTGADLGRR